MQFLLFLLEGIAYYSHSLPVRSLRRLTSLTQKIIQIFCLVLNDFVFNTSRSFISIPMLTKKRGTLQFLFFLLEGIAYYSHSLPVRSLRRLTSLTQKIIQIFCLVLNDFVFNTSRSFISIPVLTKKRGALQVSLFFIGDDRDRTCGLLNANQMLSQLSYIPKSLYSYTSIENFTRACRIFHYTLDKVDKILLLFKKKQDWMPA